VQIDKKRPGGYLLSHALRSTIGVRGLDFRVRDGNGYGPSTMATGPTNSNSTIANAIRVSNYALGLIKQYGQASRLISTGRLNMLPYLDLQPIDQVIFLVP
jgi:hypothetical protein